MSSASLHPPVLDRRRAGVLLHITSLPGPYGQGDFSHDAYRFIDFLAARGFSVWQTLPLGPTHIDGSPYQCLSAHAGNPEFISLHWLVDRGWLEQLPESCSRAEQGALRRECLNRAYQGFLVNASTEQHAQLAAFCADQAHWLDDYALFMAVRAAHAHSGWRHWPKNLRDRKVTALRKARKDYAAAIAQCSFEQWLFHLQWQELRRYARERGVLMYGDMPIFVSGDSADVWAQRDCFLLDAQGNETVVAGVPPDYFAEQGQRWGNPLYDWKRMQSDDFRWWRERVAGQLQLFDWVRIDHFRGLEAYWEIPASSPSAMDGRWVEAPGAELLQSLRSAFGHLPLIAEDLGVITPGVEALRDQFELPGMYVLQFAFDGDPRNAYLPHNHRVNGVVYTGTHDNDTTLSWFHGLDDGLRHAVYDYFGHPSQAMPAALVRIALASPAKLAVIPMQDLLGLGSGERMNTPGTTEGNWQWRFDWWQINEGLLGAVQHWLYLYDRQA